MKLFDLVGSKVVIHNDTLGIPCFKRLWESTSDKMYATNLISYIVLKNYHDSPYVKSMQLSVREATLRKELFDAGWEPTEDVVEAEASYIEFCDTLNLKLLRSFRNKLDSISDFLEEPSHGMDMKMVKDILSAAAMLDKTIRSIDSLEKQVRKEEIESVTARGGSEIGHYEIPIKR